MGKYLELFRGEVGDLTEKTKLENKPYVSYSTKLGKVTYTVVPAKDPVIEGPADNEIWYATTDGEAFTWPYENGGWPEYAGDYTFGCGKLISNTYQGGFGKLVFEYPVVKIMQDTIFTCSVFSSNPDYKVFIDKPITELILPDSVTVLGNLAFAGCSSLISISIPSEISSIPMGLFLDCRSLSQITYKGTINMWQSLDKDFNWNSGCPEITVHCTDGDIVIPAT